VSESVLLMTGLLGMWVGLQFSCMSAAMDYHTAGRGLLHECWYACRMLGCCCHPCAPAHCPSWRTACTSARRDSVQGTGHWC
jgi:hypothetical protein